MLEPKSVTPTQIKLLAQKLNTLNKHLTFTGILRDEGKYGVLCGNGTIIWLGS